ncbi:MAG: STAS domain-containing protein [Candidatus Rifleibacteriota bacterium]
MFSTEHKLDGQILVFFIKGYFQDESGTSLLEKVREELTGKKLRGIVLDFSQCTSINSSGVARLMDTSELVVLDHETDLVVCGLDKTKSSFFEMFGILELAELKENLDGAVAYLKK